MLTPVHTVALPMILGVGNGLMVVLYTLLVALHPVAGIVSTTLTCAVPAALHCTVIVAALAPVVKLTGLPPCVTVHTYVLPLLNAVLYVVVVPVHAVGAPVTVGVGTGLMVIAIGAVSVVQLTALVSRTLILPLVLFQSTVVVALVAPLCITPPVTVQL